MMSIFNHPLIFIRQLVIVASVSSHCVVALGAEPELTVAALHPDSRKLLEESRGTVPDQLAKTYRILFLHNIGVKKGDDPLKNGYLVLRDPVLHQADFEKFSAEEGNQIHILLKNDALKHYEPIKKLTPPHKLALVVDDSWIFLIEEPQELNADAKVMTFSTLSKLDQHRALLFNKGKRDKDNKLLKIYPELGDYPSAKPVPGKEGFFISPYTKKIIDAQYMDSGLIMNDPDFLETEGKFFFLP